MAERHFLQLCQCFFQLIALKTSQVSVLFGVHAVGVETVFQEFSKNAFSRAENKTCSMLEESNT